MSILKSIRYYWFDHQRKKQQPRSAVFPAKNAWRKVLLLYESDILEKNPEVKEIIRRLMHEERDVTAWGYLDVKNPRSAILPQSRVLGRRDITFLHDLKQSVQEELRERQYDLLIDLTEHPCLPLHYAAMYAQAAFKTGRHIVEGIHDLMVDMPAADNPTPLYEQIIHFLTTIRSNDK